MATADKLILPGDTAAIRAAELREEAAKLIHAAELLELEAIYFWATLEINL